MKRLRQLCRFLKNQENDVFGLKKKKKKKKEVDLVPEVISEETVEEDQDSASNEFIREEYNRITDEISRLNYELRRDISRLDELNKALSDLTKLLDKN